MRIRHKKILLIVLAALILAVILWLILSSKSKAPTDAVQASIIDANTNAGFTTNGNAEVDWPKAISILRSGEVSEITQNPDNMEVVMRMNNGDLITSKQPGRGEILVQLELCGQVCQNIRHD